jgi:hypothetical protein
VNGVGYLMGGWTSALLGWNGYAGWEAFLSTLQDSLRFLDLQM